MSNRTYIFYGGIILAIFLTFFNNVFASQILPFIILTYLIIVEMYYCPIRTISAWGIALIITILFALHIVDKIYVDIAITFAIIYFLVMTIAIIWKISRLYSLLDTKQLMNTKYDTPIREIIPSKPEVTKKKVTKNNTLKDRILKVKKQYPTWTSTRIAEKVGVHRSTVSKYLRLQ